MEHGFTWYALLDSVTHWDAWAHAHGLHNGLKHIFSAVLASFILLTIGLIWGSAQRRAGAAAIVPEPKLTGRNAGDLIAGALDGLVLQIIGPHGRKYTPIFGTVFLFIFINNAMGLIPGFEPATGNISTNFGVALVIFVLTHAVGIKSSGLGYFKHFLGPMLALAPLMLPIELISHIARPASLSIRLFGNMTGDHLVLGIFSGLVPLFVPIIFLFLGLFVCLMQAYVFMMLSMLYISMAESHDH